MSRCSSHDEVDPSNQRVYREADVRRLTFIRRCCDFGFSIDQVRLLMSLMHDGRRSCTKVREIASQHLTGIRKKLVELRELERSVAAFVESCDR
ncbi:MerR family DNA-binding protein [Dyella sp. 2HG41-7]|uniref:MerR family DNA-binding protein n=1 Tax=Dyella sp. 2HG41-7 TaxID=2883239 RepID=UPI0031F2EA07